MNKLVSKNPIQRFKLGSRIEKFQTPSRGITINKSEVSRFGPTATRILQGWKNSFFPDIPENDNTIYMSTPSPRRQNTQSSDSTQVSTGTSVQKTTGNSANASVKKTATSKTTNYSGTVWNYLNSKANQFGGWQTNPNNGNQYFTITNDDGSKVNVFGNGQMYNQSGKLVGSITEQDITNANQRKTPVRKPAVTKPAAVTNRVATRYTLPGDITDVASVQRLLRDNNYYDQNYVNSGAKIDDGIWGKETQAAYDRYKQAVAANSNVTTPPANTGTTVSGKGYSFTLPTNTNINTDTNTNIYESYYPGTYSNLDNIFTRKGIRSNRGTNYSNVNEYWNWLQNNKDSEDYKVWSNIMGNDRYLNKEIFDNVMSQYGIRGNLGRRDSGRLSNLLNDLNLIGVQGRDKNGNIVMSDARRAFLTNFDRNLPSSEEINEYVETNTPVRTNTPARYDLYTINWGSSPGKMSFNNPFGFSKSEFPHLLKNGGLISRNPINRFKSNFR